MGENRNQSLDLSENQQFRKPNQRKRALQQRQGESEENGVSRGIPFPSEGGVFAEGAVRRERAVCGPRAQKSLSKIWRKTKP